MTNGTTLEQIEKVAGSITYKVSNSVLTPRECLHFILGADNVGQFLPDSVRAQIKDTLSRPV